MLNCVNKNGKRNGCDMGMMEENSSCRKNLEMIYETKKNVDILNKEIENIKDRLDEFKLETKEDMKQIDDKLELILQDKKDSYNKIKQTIISVVITGLCVLLASTIHSSALFYLSFIIAFKFI